MPAASGNSSISGSTAETWPDAALSRPPTGWLRALAAAVLTAVVVLALTTAAAHRQMQVLSTAATDNVEFSLFQADREFLKFRLSLAETETIDGMDGLREDFDVVYARIRSIAEAPLYAPLRADPTFLRALGEIRAFLSEAIRTIDAPDAVLLRAIPDLQARAGEISEDVRWLALNGLSRFAEARDAQRDRFLLTLTWLLGLAIALFAGLILSLAWLVRLLGLSQRRAGEISAAASRMHTIVETSLDAILLTDLAGRVIDANAAARDLFAFESGGGVGRNVRDLLPCGGDEDRFACLRLGRRPRPDERQFECHALTGSDRRIPVEVALDLARGRREPGYVVFIRDISIRRAAEDALRSARDQALAGERAKAKFLAVMSHEMRTPLNGLLGSLQMMPRDTVDVREARLIRAMETSGDVLRGLIDDVLLLSKYDAGALRAESVPVDPHALLAEIAEALEPLAMGRGNRLYRRWLGPPSGPVCLSERHLRQVLVNLVGNAAKFTRDGRIDLEAERLADGRLEFRVGDTGIGIATADLDRIFDDFETLDTSLSRAAGGTGLGLAICRRLVRVMGGTIEAESAPGEGSLFRVRLPPLGATGSPEPQAAPPLPAAAALRILVVEDNPINRLVLAETLLEQGHAVETACDGYEGMELADRIRFDLILMDISMPRLDGISTTERIRAGGGASADTRVVAVTAHVTKDVRDRLRAAGIRFWLPKPIPHDRLLAVLRAGAEPELRTAPTLPLVDADRVAELQRSMARETLDRLHRTFATEAAAALADPHAPGAPDRLHHAAGSAASFGLDRLHASLCEMECQSREAGSIDAASLRRARHLWAESRRELERLLTEEARRSLPVPAN